MLTCNILVIEDSLAYSTLLQAQLARQPGYLVTIVHTLADGVAAIKTNTYDVILLDLTLPDSTGLETVKALAAFKVPIVVLTGAPVEGIADEAAKLGVTKLLEKNTALGIDAILNALSGAMGKTKIYRATTQQLKIADEVHHLSLRNTAYILACASIFTVNFIAMAAFAIDAWAQITFFHKYDMPGWIGAIVLPMLMSAVAWLYSKRQQEYLEDQSARISDNSSRLNSLEK